jgi:MarR family transcriptional regulator, organic hydroperoxide resistance regulator
MQTAAAMNLWAGIPKRILPLIDPDHSTIYSLGTLVIIVASCLWSSPALRNGRVARHSLSRERDLQLKRRPGAADSELRAKPQLVDLGVYPQDKDGLTPKGTLSRDHNIGYLLHDTTRLLMRLLQQRLDAHGITLGNWFILRELWESDGLILRELASRMDLLGPSIVAAVDLMEKRGLVSRERNRIDRRQVHVFLTEKGHQMREPLLELSRDATMIGVRGFKDADIVQLRRLLLIMRENCRTEQVRTDGEPAAGSKRRTPGEKANIILEVLKGQISVTEAAVKYSFTQSEYQQWTKAYHQGAKGRLTVDEDATTSRSVPPQRLTKRRRQAKTSRSRNRD